MLPLDKKHIQHLHPIPKFQTSRNKPSQQQLRFSITITFLHKNSTSQKQTRDVQLKSLLRKLHPRLLLLLLSPSISNTAEFFKPPSTNFGVDINIFRTQKDVALMCYKERPAAAPKKPPVLETPTLPYTPTF